MPEKCILLEDINAFKQTNKWGILSAKSFTEDRILRGSLLVELTDAESRETNLYFSPPLNYKRYSDESVMLYCTPSQVLQLNDQQFNLLLGVKHPFDRFRALNILHWVEKLRVGVGVKVAICGIHNPAIGVIRYLGQLPGEEGIKFGIELLVSE